MKKSVTLSIVIFMFMLSLCGCNETDDIKYSQSENWAILSSEIAKEVDLFIISPTVDMGTDTKFNMSLEDEKMKEKFVGALNMQTGIYNDECNIFSPYYRQMTISGYEADNQDRYMDTAYQDVKAAFLYYFENYNKGRPFILAGFSQGSQLGVMLMEDLFDEDMYSEKMVAAYLLGWRITADTISKSPWIKMAEGETDTGCVISFNSEAPEVDNSFVVPKGMKTFGINPLNWKTDETVAEANLNIGACFTDYSGNITKEIPSLTGAYLDKTRGTLKVLDVTPEEYPPVLSIFSEGEFHLYDYQFFYKNLQENVSKRVAEYLK